MAMLRMPRAVVRLRDYGDTLLLNYELRELRNYGDTLLFPRISKGRYGEDGLHGLLLLPRTGFWCFGRSLVKRTLVGSAGV
jgi:hypothetical protein